MISFLQVNILSADMRHHRRQFAVTDCPYKCNNTSDYPYHQQPAGRSYITGNICADNENTRSYHCPGYN